MSQHIRSVYLLLWILAALGSGYAQTVVKRVPPKPTVATDGKVLFRDYCAACHGADARGAGPAAAALKTAPPDLTQLARNSGGSFPEERFLRILRGDDGRAAHGNQQMPIWGTVFQNQSSNPTLVQTRIHSLLQYVEDLQAK